MIDNYYRLRYNDYWFSRGLYIADWTYTHKQKKAKSLAYLACSESSKQEVYLDLLFCNAIIISK